MKLKRLVPEGLLLFELDVFPDDRGSFCEVFREEWVRSHIGDLKFVQDNISVSKKNVLRGLHFQEPPHAQGKLVTVLRGRIVDVAVDIRKRSSYYGKFAMLEISASNPVLLWIPPGFAHGFLALEENTIVHYKCTAYYCKEAERTLLWNDPGIGIPWPISDPLLSPKDSRGILLDEYNSPF